MNHIVTQCAPLTRRMLVVAALGVLGACASNGQDYAARQQAQAELQMRTAAHDPAPDTPGMYLGLIGRMQVEGLYYASLAHIDAYEHRYGASSDSIALRADALRATRQPQASAAAYSQLLTTPLAARAHRGLGLLAGAAGHYREAARELGEAAQLEPTNALTLSDLGYALLRDGAVSRARVPLLQAIELDPHDPTIAANLALYFVASGDTASAQALIAQQALPPDTQTAIERDALNVARAQRAREIDERRAVVASAALPATAGTVARADWPGSDVPPRLLERIAR